MNTSDVKRVLEGALLCASKPLTVSELRQVFSDDVAVSPDTVRALLESLREDWRGRSVELATLATGWRFQSAPDIARFVIRLYPEKTPRYSRAVME
ncbi:MAG: SMC-Scp complex subunit ScpB, partial [Lautropia sp.]